MTDREKLIDLLCSVYVPIMNGNVKVGEFNIAIDEAEVIADYLIQNGVTFATDNNVGHKEEVDFDYSAED